MLFYQRIVSLKLTRLLKREDIEEIKWHEKHPALFILMGIIIDLS